MTEQSNRIVAGVDVGTECVKAVVLGAEERVLGRAVVPTRGYFQACAYEVLTAALDDAQRPAADLDGVWATGFGAACVKGASATATEATCHALGAFHHLGEAATLIVIGGREPQVVAVDRSGIRGDARGSRRCALGIGSFLMFTARHLDVHPTRLQELAAGGDRPVPVSSYCSVFSSTEILERLRDGATCEEVALGSMHSIAERIVEIGGLEAPVAACGGVAEYFPGVVHALEAMAGTPVRIVADPIHTAALGAALQAWRA